MAPVPGSLRSLPAVESLLKHPRIAEALREVPRALVVEAVRSELAEERTRLRGSGGTPATPQTLAERAANRATAALRPHLRRVLNATGVVLHTNLGRAPLSDAARRAVGEIAGGYSSLEFDLATGRRGERGLGVEQWLCRLTGAQAACVVNNGAAALLLVLSSLAWGRKVVVSRGELVEIGGSFRIPDIMAKSGAQLLEIGTTNRTHLRDYERALKRDPDVAAVLRVHPSNFRIAGFTTRPSLEELAGIAHRHRLPLIEDLGSGALVDLTPFGLEREPTVRESLTAGCDVVTFSGDKLLGATQAGLILGRKRLVDRARRDPLARTLRVDKLTLAALEATLAAYCDPARAIEEIPALAMLRAAPEALERRARSLALALEISNPGLKVAVERGTGEVGGGAMPLQRLRGWVVTLEWAFGSAQELDAISRAADPPLIGYIRGGKLRLDVRTLTDEEAAEAVKTLQRALQDHRDSGSPPGRPT